MAEVSNCAGPAAHAWLGDEEGFGTFYRDNARTILLYFVRRTSDADSALDMTAETFAQAFAARRTFRGQSDAEAAAWLYAIAARQFSRHLRRGYTERKLIRRLGIDVPAATEIESERVLELAGLDALRPIVARELGRLSRPQRDAIQLRVVEELPYAVVADRLKITEQAARMRVSRALAKLAFALESGQPLRESYEQSH